MRYNIASTMAQIPIEERIARSHLATQFPINIHGLYRAATQFCKDFSGVFGGTPQTLHYSEPESKTERLPTMSKTIST